MDELRKLMAFGKELGYTGSDLQKYIDRETDRIETKRKSDLEREERMKERECTREKEREIFEKEKQEKELEMLKVQADIAEKSSKTPPATGKLGVSSLKMPAFEEHRDQLDAYLERFERFATGEKWNKIDWAIRLSALLKGKALDVFSRLPEEEALDYDKLKVALLKNYQMTEDGYRVRFRTCRPEKLETPSQFAARISSYLHNWIKMTHINKTYEDLIDLLLREQFINACSKEMTMYLKERKCSNINSMCELAEQYVEAHGQHSFASYFSKNVSASNTFSKSNLKNNSSSEKTNTGKPKQLIQSSNSSPSFKCYNCGRQGHKASQCKEPKKQRSSISVHGMLALEQHKAITEAVKEGVKEALLSTSKSEGNACLLDECKQQHEPLNVLNLSCEASAGEPRSHPPGMPTCKGIVSNTVVSVLRDTGCSTAVVRSELVDPEELTGETRTCVLIDGTEKKFPLAVVYVDSPFYKGQVEALCIDNPVYDLIIGNVNGARQPQDPDPNWLPGELKSDTNIVSAVETRAAAKKKGKPLKPLHVSSPIQDVNYDEFVKAQHEDPSLSSLWGKVSEQQDGKYKYIVKNKVLVRQYQNRDRKDTYHSRVVVPVKYRNEVCRIAHESILSGHQGKARTYDKVASQFYWPGIHDTVGKFVASCDICQKTLAKGKVGKVPLGKMPLIEEPFKRVAMDLVGPIYPASDRGKRFILTIMDYATRYPEAVALSNIDTETVAEALLQVYSRVGIPSEILTDMGTQFTSAVMREVSRLLTIKQNFSKIDLSKGYWQIPMKESSKEKTAFVTPDGQYCFRYMPFGLVNSSQVFTRMMRSLFNPVKCVVNYIDDLLIFTDTWSEHVEKLRQVFNILKDANLTARPSKCFLGFRNLEFLGHQVGSGRLCTNPDLLKKIQDADRPQNKKQIRSFLGLTGYYRRFVPNYAQIALPLTDLTRKGQPNKLQWEEPQENAFLTLKSLLVQPPILHLPDLNKTFVVRTDASDVGLGAILLQEHQGILHPIAYASKKLAPRERNYSTIERECLAIVWAIQKFEMYLFNKSFMIQTDHQPLAYVNRAKTLNKRIMGWAMVLQEYRYRVEAIPGKDNVGPDYLSRVPGHDC